MVGKAGGMRGRHRLTQLEVLHHSWIYRLETKRKQHRGRKITHMIEI